MNGKVYFNDADTVLFKGISDDFGDWARTLFRDHAQMGIKHTMPIGATIKLLKHISWTNTIGLNDYMYFTHYEKHWVHDTDSTGHVKTDTIFGFRNLIDFNVTTRLTTKIYGMKSFSRGPIRAIRHVITPEIGFTYRPNFGDPKWGVYGTYVDGNGVEQTYNKFDRSLYGTPSQTQQALLT